MEYIRKAFRWMAANPITMASVVVIFVCLIVLAWVNFQGSAFIAMMQDRQATVRQIDGFRSTSVQVPPPSPDQPPVRYNIAVNEAAIRELTTAYEKMDTEYNEIFKVAVQVNRLDHYPMEDKLFPTPSDPGRPFAAKERYIESFDEMLGPPSFNTLLPRLNAGGPLSMTAVTQALAEVEQAFLSQYFQEMSVADLGETERKALADRKLERLKDLIRRHAEARTIYVAGEPRTLDPWGPSYPFDVGNWARPGPPPTMEQLWEGQMELWFQQDIVKAIAQTNRVESSDSNVLNAVIKRLIKIDVQPRYVGIDHTGLLVQRGGSGAPQAAPDQKIPDNFAISHTGRASNTIYDVRHAEVRFHADFQRLNEFLDELSKVNFMTVLKLDVQQVDEYEMLQAGFVYGSDDVVSVTMLIESVWLRAWTAQYMPPEVRTRLGVLLPGEAEAVEGQVEGEAAPAPQ